MKKYIILLLILFISACSININFNTNDTQNMQEQNNNIKYNNELQIKLISINCSNDTTQIIAKVTNNTGKTYEKEEIKIIIYMTDGTIKTLPGFFGDNLKQGQTRTINTQTDKNLCNYYKIEFIQ